MAGIGFELRKLFRKEGLLNNLRAYAYSSMTTVGPMILCMSLIIILQRLMSIHEGTYLDWELYIATVSYCFIFSIVMTSGISLVVTRYVSDCLYTKQFSKLMSSYYGVLSLIVPIASITAAIFLSRVDGSLAYKFSAFFFFVFLVMIWIQGVYLSALKDYMRIARSFLSGAGIAVLVAWVLMKYFSISTLLGAFIGLDAGFLTICLLTGLHMHHKFPKADSGSYYEFLLHMKKYPALFFSGMLVYSGIYLHNFVYWFSDNGQVIGGAYRVFMFYDVPVFYAFLTVLPTLVAFVVSVETSFFEKFRHYYLYISADGTIQDIQNAKKQMQKTLMREISFLMEIQLVVTVLSLGAGMLLLPKIGFTMQQLDLFIILALAYYLFIILFSFVHILMYFDDRKGVLWTSLLFVALNIGCTIATMQLNYDGLGMFIASFVSLLAVSARLLYVVRNIDYYTFCAQPISNNARQKRGKGKAGIVATMLIACLLATACSSGASSQTEANDSPAKMITVDHDYRLKDDKRLYNRDQDDSLKALYVTVLPAKGEQSSFDWYALNRQVDKESGKSLEVIVQEGLPDGSGPKPGMFEHDATAANASIAVRGNSAWSRVQKSYKLKLYEETGLYMDQRTLNLNKHIDDLSRLRNKLSFDLMETIPDMTSLRTQFVRLYVKDLTQGEKQAPYVDYGLYTNVEQPNKRFLKAHMLDSNAYFYKVKFFEFHRYPDQIKSTTDEAYDVAKFEKILEIKGREEHDKLIAMLEAVNDYSIPIEETVEKYFDLDNFLTWTAMNILMDNMDTDANNFFLYSPLNIDKWYFLPWDYDGGWELQRNMKFIRPYQTGLSNYWGVELHNRFFRNQENVNKLTRKMEELSQYINEETVKAQIDKYRAIVEPFVSRMPDIQYLPDRLSAYDQDIQRIIDTPKRGLERYYDDLEKPKPFYLNEATQRDGRLYFDWGVSFDLQDDELTYEMVIAKNKEFTDVVYENKQLREISHSIPELAPGRYFWRVDVVDGKGNRQFNFEIYTDEEGEMYYGIKDFEVN
ncbi:exopolysaccharide Pel transporter PelG [Cohnella sp.]|uniref:exopolysaccharide Pel transporter PelG n=1 Tax=Cohnella sp. TaxID=1883426 RepID=UPI00356475BF